MKSRLKVLLAEKNMKQGELCDVLGFNSHTVSEIALAKVKKLDMLKMQKITIFLIVIFKMLFILKK